MEGSGSFMFKIRLTKSPFSFISFDGLVLEYFADHNETGRRYHVDLVKSIELTTDKKGMHYLKMSTNRISLSQELDEQVVSEVKELVAEVQKAMK
jgi:hypothetical protein